MLLSLSSSPNFFFSACAFQMMIEEEIAEIELVTEVIVMVIAMEIGTVIAMVMTETVACQIDQDLVIEDLIVLVTEEVVEDLGIVGVIAVVRDLEVVVLETVKRADMEVTEEVVALVTEMMEDMEVDAEDSVIVTKMVTDMVVRKDVLMMIEVIYTFFTVPMANQFLYFHMMMCKKFSLSNL